MNALRTEASIPVEPTEAGVRAALSDQVPECLAPLEVIHDGSYQVRVRGQEVRRCFELDGGQLNLTKIAVVDGETRRGLATAVTLFVMDRLDPHGEVAVTGLQPPGRLLWNSLAAKGYVRILTTTSNNHTVCLTETGIAYVRSLPSRQGRKPRPRWWHKNR